MVTDLNGFIEKAKLKHGNKYDYSKVEYVKSDTKVKIVCPEHGEFEQRPKDHYRYGCKECGLQISKTVNLLDKEEFIKRAKFVHGDRYDYSKVNYVDSKTKVVIICQEHGEFEQMPRVHIKNHGCQKCGMEISKNSSFISKNEFVKKANIVHNNKYDYSKVLYENTKTKVIIICPEHGEFEQRPNDHYKYGCQKCGMEKSKNINLLDKEEFIKRAKFVHGNKYDYSKVDYTNSKTKVKILCVTHGVFEQKPKDHLQGCGCQTCANETSTSSFENELIEIYKSFDPITSDRNLLSPLELDIVIPSYKLAIEFNGSYWHNEDNKDKNYHKMKSDLCEANGYRLVHIYEHEWVIPQKRKIILGIINTHLNLNKRIFARKCEIREINSVDERKFVDENHLQGYSASTKAYGLYYENKLVQIISLKLTNRNLNSWEIQRMCNLIGYTVVGGTSKLFKQCKTYLEEQNFKELITYSDKGTFTGKIYEELGFTKLKDTEPNYLWQKGNETLSRQSCQKQKLVKQGYDEKLTEIEIMRSRGYRRIFNSGNRKYKI